MNGSFIQRTDTLDIDYQLVRGPRVMQSARSFVFAGNLWWRSSLVFGVLQRYG
jgi:hypothetical protein